MQLNWDWRKFEEISGHHMHEMLFLRQAVFVVEQHCAYQDADTLDRDAWHLFGRDTRGLLLAYARITFPGVKYGEPSFGRVLTSPAVRGQGLGRQLVQRCIDKCALEYPEMGIRISAQQYLQQFYESFGLETVGQSYDEDGIEHIEMVL